MFKKGLERDVKSIPEMRDILSGLSFDSIVVFDMDNTILKSRHELGSDQWFGAMLGIAKSKHGEKFEFELMKTTYNQVQSFVEMEVIEEKTIIIMKLLAEIGITQILLTARNNELREVTTRQLESHGIHFNPKFMVFCDGKDKGECLEDLLSSLECRVPHIVMIDDKKYNVDSVRAAAIRMKARFHGFVYEFMMAEVQSFDVGHAHFQLSLVKHLLDERAKHFIDSLHLPWKKEHEDACSVLHFHQFSIEVQSKLKHITQGL